MSQLNQVTQRGIPSMLLRAFRRILGATPQRVSKHKKQNYHAGWFYVKYPDGVTAKVAKNFALNLARNGAVEIL
jgi:hypothetical protein